LRNAWSALGVALALELAGAAAAQGQGRVAGRVTILEKDNAASRDVSDAVLWLETAAGGTVEPLTFDISINDKTYAPRVVVAPIGSTVRFPNHDPFRHNVFSVSDPNAFDLGLFGRNERRSHTFTSPGLVRVYCNVHPRMVAYVVLVGNGHYTQPANDGTFALGDVPSGRYRLHVWHERIPSVVIQDVVAAAGGAPVQVQLDARKYRWLQHRNKTGRTYPTNAGRERY